MVVVLWMIQRTLKIYFLNYALSLVSEKNVLWILNISLEMVFLGCYILCHIRGKVK